MLTTLLRREVTGVSYSKIDMFSTHFKMSAMILIGKFREPFEIVNKPLFGQGKEFSHGSRFSKDEEVLRRVLCAISSAYGLDQGSNPIAEVERKERQHLGSWVWEALRDCASADYWYMYEKRYD